MAKWTPFPHAGDYPFDAASVKKHWARLHGGDAEPCPKDAAVLDARALFHNGDFEKAARLHGRRWQALPQPTKCHLHLCQLPGAQGKDAPGPVHASGRKGRGPGRRRTDNANAWYWHAYAQGRAARASAWPKRWRKAWAAR